MSEAARRTIPGLRASGVAASDEVGRDIRGSTTILELLRMFPDGRAAKLMSDIGFAKAGDAWRWRGRRGHRPDRATSRSHAFAELAKLKKT